MGERGKPQTQTSQAVKPEDIDEGEVWRLGAHFVTVEDMGTSSQRIFLFEMVSMGAFSVALFDLIIIILISDSTGTSDERPANQPMAVIADLLSHFPEF